MAWQGKSAVLLTTWRSGDAWGSWPHLGRLPALPCWVLSEQISGPLKKNNVGPVEGLCKDLQLWWRVQICKPKGPSAEVGRGVTVSPHYSKQQMIWRNNSTRDLKRGFGLIAEAEVMEFNSRKRLTCCGWRPPLQMTAAKLYQSEFTALAEPAHVMTSVEVSVKSSLGL